MYSRSSQQLLKRINDSDKRKAAQFIVVNCAVQLVEKVNCIYAD